MQGNSAHVRPVEAENGTPKASSRSRLPPPSVSVVSTRSFSESIWVMEIDCCKCCPLVRQLILAEPARRQEKKIFTCTRGQRHALLATTTRTSGVLLQTNNVADSNMRHDAENVHSWCKARKYVCPCKHVNNLLAISTRTPGVMSKQTTAWPWVNPCAESIPNSCVESILGMPNPHTCEEKAERSRDAI